MFLLARLACYAVAASQASVGGSTPGLAHQHPSVDLRAQFAEYGIPVRQQGKRGACQVFAMVAPAEFLEAKKGHHVDLSEQYLMAAADAACGLHRTDGFNPDLLIKGWRQFGICEERFMPYVPLNLPIGPMTEDSLHNAMSRRQIKVTQIKHWTRPIGFNDNDMNSIIAQLDADVPVTVTLCWPQGLYDEQIIDRNDMLLDHNIDGRDKSGHGEVVVGYDFDKSVDGGGYFWLRNSWSTKFADHGYLKISFAMARKYGIDAYVVEIK